MTGLSRPCTARIPHMLQAQVSDARAGLDRQVSRESTLLIDVKL